MHLFRVVVLQKRLLKALCAPTLNAETIDLAWLQGVWGKMDPEWVRRSCLGGQKSPLMALGAMAGSSLTARQALYDEFRRQNRVGRTFYAGGDFRDIRTLNDVDSAIARAAGDYLCKNHFPLLACSPWNLVPVCSSCNEVGAKGDRLAVTHGSANPMADWLHPLFRAASAGVQIRLSGAPNASIPSLYSPNAAEQNRLNNHSALIHTLSDRWTTRASAFFDGLVNEVQRRSTAT